MQSNKPHSLWPDDAVAALRADFGEHFGDRTILVTGADGFMGSHLTDALVLLGANVHALVRATSSGALNNISHLRGQATAGRRARSSRCRNATARERAR